MSARGKTGAHRHAAREATAAGMAQQILLAQLKLIESHAGRAARPCNVKATHDLRVAIRRFRTALRTFARFLPHRAATRLSLRLKTVNRQLGPVRDAQVWMGFLARAVTGFRRGDPDGWARCLREARASCRAREAEVESALGAIPFDALRALHARAGDGTMALPFLSRKLHRHYGHLLRYGRHPAIKSSERAHALRRRCRRARYLAEFAAPLAGPATGRLARRLKAVADALGDRHDAEVQSALLDAMTAPPAQLRHQVEARRKQAVRAFERAWARLGTRPFCETVQAEWRAAQKTKEGLP